MTDEQIKQNAEAYADAFCSRDDQTGMWQECCNIFIAGAHSLDEEIKELNARIVKLMCERDSIKSESEYLINKLRNPWISVEDRLPDNENNPDEYNAPHRARSSRNVIITDGVIVNRGYYSYARMRWEWNEGEINVSHWMPIPQIKKGE